MFTYGCRADASGLPVNPVLGTDKRRQAPPAALDYYEVEEVEALARACEQGGQREPREIFDEAEREARHQEDKQDAEAFRLLFYTGLQVGEMLTLRWGDINLDGRLIAVRRGLSAGVEGCRRVVARGSCRSPCLRCMRSRDSARARISRALRTMSSSIASVAGSMPLRFGAATSGDAMAAGLRPVRLHGLRHAAGSLVARTSDPVFVRDFLGHQKLSTTDRYVSAKARPRSSSAWTPHLRPRACPLRPSSDVRRRG